MTVSESNNGEAILLSCSVPYINTSLSGIGLRRSSSFLSVSICTYNPLQKRNVRYRSLSTLREAQVFVKYPRILRSV